MISEKQKEEIRKEARVILDRFAKSLESVKPREKRLKRQEGGYREEGKGNGCDEGFRERMFANAPQARGDCLIAEKKKWQ